MTVKIKSHKTKTSAAGKYFASGKVIPLHSILIGKVLIKNSKLMFYYMHDTGCLCVLLMDKTTPGVHHNYLPVWHSPVTVKPVKIKRSKDVIRFYFSKGKNSASVKFSLKAILSNLEKEGLIKEKPLDEKIVLERASENPILSPCLENRWESSAVFNAGAIYLNDKVHFIYRAIGESGLSVFGYAFSIDGVHIDERSEIPAFVYGKLLPKQKQGFTPYPYLSGGSWWGCEDPRLTVLGETIFMTFTAFNGMHPPCVALTSIAINDFLRKQWNWEEPKIISEPGKINKNWVVFPEKFDDQFAILHSISPEISIDFRNTLDFASGQFISSYYHPKKEKNCWDKWIRGVGAPPLKTEKGWLVLYHAMDYNDPDKYKLGAMILDKNNPNKILYRSKYPLLEPDEWYENDGLKRGVIYNCGAVIVDEKLIVYYGGSDTYLCSASVDLGSLLSHLSNSKKRLYFKRKSSKQELALI
jgi:predicted GH43/DUF377 family glycosyl hydrolase